MLAGDLLYIIDKRHQGVRHTPRRKPASRPNGTPATLAPKKKTKAPRWIAPNNLKQADAQGTRHGHVDRHAP